MQSSDYIDDTQTDNWNLLHFPDEILLEIFKNLSDNSLLQAVGVCSRFKVLAEESFEKRYNGSSADKFYSLEIAGESFTEEHMQYQAFFRYFGRNMRAIHINFRFNVVATNLWLITLIQCYCNSITKIKISRGKGVDLFRFVCLMPNLTQLSLDNVSFLNHNWAAHTYPKLVLFSGEDSEGDQDAFEAFIRLNPQLEDISLIRFIGRTNTVLCTLSGTLTKLKTLTLVGDNEGFTKTVSFSAMDSLRSLTVNIDKGLFSPLLDTIRGGLKNIDKLTIYNWRDLELRVEDISLLCSFNMLKELQLQDSFRLTIELLKTLIVHLPKLENFSLGHGGDLYRTADDILNVVYVCRKLSQLELEFINLPTLNYDFCKRFADIMEINDCNLELVLVFNETDKMTFTRDEATQCLHVHELYYTEPIPIHRILYWKGYDAAFSSSNKNLLDLNKKILHKIASFLDGEALAALFDTCRRGQQLSIDYLNESKVFHCAVFPWKPRSKPTSENVLAVLGQYIHRIDIDSDVDLIVFAYGEKEDEDDEATETHQLKTKFMKCVNRYCGNVLTEMKITSTIPMKTVLHWPSLRKLQLSHVRLEILRLFECPELTHLIISRVEADDGDIVGSGNFVNPFPKLTNLRFEHYNDSVEAFLSSLNQRTCIQMRELYLSGSFDNNAYNHWLKLTNTIVRFSHLATLHLHINGIERSNFKYLFENCSMLVESTIFGTNARSFSRGTLSKIVCAIKRSCKHIQIIRLVGALSGLEDCCKLDLKKMVPEVTFD